jgi:hypothetical protein
MGCRRRDALVRARRLLVQLTIVNNCLLGRCQCLVLFQRRNANGAVSTDLDDTVGRWHLQDQVPVVGDGHELVQGWPIDDGMEGDVDLRDVKDDALRVVVLRRTEHHLEGDATAQNNRAQAHT